MSAIKTDLIEECKIKLLELKSDLLNRGKEIRASYSEHDNHGDEMDRSVGVLAEGQFLANQERLRKQLVAIENALARIENGTFGVCEETDEAIEPARLRTIPWTKLSIEGAEIKESMKKRFAR